MRPAQGFAIQYGSQIAHNDYLRCSVDKQNGLYDDGKVMALLRMVGWHVNHTRIERPWGDNFLRSLCRNKKRKCRHYEVSVSPPKKSIENSCATCAQTQSLTNGQQQEHQQPFSPLLLKPKITKGTWGLICHLWDPISLRPPQRPPKVP